MARSRDGGNTEWKKLGLLIIADKKAAHQPGTPSFYYSISEKQCVILMTLSQGANAQLGGIL